MKAVTPKQEFGWRFLIVILLGVALSFAYLLLWGCRDALDWVLAFPLLLLPWPDTPLVKGIFLLNAAIWGFGGAFGIVILAGKLVSPRR